MTIFRLRILLSCGVLLFLFLAIVSPAQGQNAVLGRGLEQLVQLYESGNPKLDVALKPHLTSPAGEVLIEVRLRPGADEKQVLAQLSQNGFRLQAVSLLDPSRIEGYLPISSARAASSVTGIKSLHAVQRPVTLSVGSVPAQAAIVEKADIAQARGIDGTGTKLGVLSDSYDTCPKPPDPNACATDAAQDVATGDLPSGVVVLQDKPAVLGPGTDEGRAMLQLVHKIAPGAGLAFATADGGEVNFSNNILNLRRIFGADVIVDDVVYFAEPMFSDGLPAQAVDEVVREGAAYYSSAGNNGLQAYEDRYRPISFERLQKLVAEGKVNLDLAGFQAFLAANSLPVPKSVQSFRKGDDLSVTQQFISFGNNVISFQWDEPFFVNKVKTNFDVFVFDENGHIIDPNDPNFPGFYTLDDSTQSDEAFKFLLLPVNPGSFHLAGGLFSTTYQFLIANMNDGPARHIKYVNVNGLGESERQNAPSVFGHAAAKNGQGVAAMDWSITNFPEDFSSPGPVTILFDTAGNRLEDPDIRHVPQLTAADGASTTFFGNFFGTSAAAPDAAAVAALVIQRSGGPGSISPSRVYDRLQDTATPIPLSEDRAHSGTEAGPVEVTASGDFTRFGQYFTVEADRDTKHTINSVSIDVTNTPTHMVFNPNPARFHVGTSNGIDPANISASYSADTKTVTLTFKPGTFAAGDSFTFGLSVFSPVEGTTQEDADRMQNAVVTVTLDDNSKRTGTFHVDEKQTINRFTGAGLVNADAATKRH
jgi:hypothetical protein